MENGVFREAPVGSDFISSKPHVNVNETFFIKFSESTDDVNVNSTV
jgi:hypothetical protein